MKVELPRTRETGFHNYAIGPRSTSVKRSLPVYCPQLSKKLIAHRVRRGRVHWRFDENRLRCSHVSVDFWCGNMGRLARSNLRGGGALHDRVPDGWSLCVKCAERAV